MSASQASLLPPARRAALEAIRCAENPSADLQACLNKVLSRGSGKFGLSRQDVALATELAYGYFRFRDRLHFVLDAFLRHPGGIPAPMRQAMTLAAFELLHLDRVPDYAAVDWAVEHVKRSLGPRLANVANGVLRNVARLGPEARDMAFYGRDRPSQALLWARYYSCPLWIVESWLDAYGPDTAQAWLRSSLEQPPTGVRVNWRRPGAQALLNSLCSRHRTVLRLDTGAALEKVSAESLETLVEQGRITRQSAAGQEALQALEPGSWPGPVLDACAGRGGKTGWLAERGLGPVWACDPNLRRLRGLRRELERLGLAGAVFAARAQDPLPLRAAPRAILLDAPCSGLGVLARRPDSKYKRTPQDSRQLAELQQAMLARAAESLPHGGTLAYLTCTMVPAENEQRIDGLLAMRKDLTAISTFSTDPASPLREFFFAARLFKR